MLFILVCGSQDDHCLLFCLLSQSANMGCMLIFVGLSRPDQTATHDHAGDWAGRGGGERVQGAGGRQGQPSQDLDQSEAVSSTYYNAGLSSTECYTPSSTSIPMDYRSHLRVRTHIEIHNSCPTNTGYISEGPST